MVNFSKGFLGKRGLLSKLFNKTLELTGCCLPNVCASVNFVSSDKIKELNKIYRGVDKVTDVLSFPLLNVKNGNLKEFECEREPNGLLNLGDIVLCKDKVISQAKEYNNSYKRELAFLVVHGYLHLLGYDHMTKDEEKVMMNLAENVLLNFGLERKNV